MKASQLSIGSTQANSDRRKISFASNIPRQEVGISIRNWDSPTWYKDLEFEVRNLIEKNIWYIEIDIGLPEHSRNKKEATLSLTFGQLDLEREERKPLDQRPSIKKGETCILKIPEIQIENLKTSYSPDGRSMVEVKHLKFRIWKIYYTDGTGLLNGDPIIRRNGNLDWTPRPVPQ